MSKIYTRLLITLLLTLTWSIASSEPRAEDLSVKGRAAPRSGIEQMQTFCILKVDAEKSRHLYEEYPGVADIIESAVEKNLVAKGFTKSTGQCDIEMRYNVALQEQHQLSGKRQVDTSGSGAAKRSNDTKIDVGGRLRMGAIDLNAYDKSTNRHIWKGGAVNTKGVYVDLKRPAEADMQGVEERINNAFQRLFLRFPARAKP